MKWTDALSNFSLQVIGKRTIPLSCVIRKTVVAPDPAPLLIPNKPYANEFGSVEEDLIACATHTHPLYCTPIPSIYTLRKQHALQCIQVQSNHTVDSKKDVESG